MTGDNKNQFNSNESSDDQLLNTSEKNSTTSSNHENDSKSTSNHSQSLSSSSVSKDEDSKDKKDERPEPRKPVVQNTLNRTVSTTQNSNARSSISTTLTSDSKREQALQDEATRLFREMASDPDIMDQAFNAAFNPNVAMELARQADTAWRNIETLPGAFRALCQMHHNLQQPLWNAVIGQDLPTSNKYQDSDFDSEVPNEPIKAEPMPNPWKPESRNTRSTTPLSFPFTDLNPFTFPNFNGNTPTPPPQGQREEMLSEIISRTRTNSFQTASQLIQNAERKYSKEIEELAEMGITDREKCLSALEAADGDLFQALGIIQNLDDLEKEEINNN